MNPNRFDSIAKLFATRRLSRRQALAQAGIAAGAVAAVRMASPTDAQDATPAADGEQGPTMLFLQAFQSGGVTPAEGADDRYTLTLEQGLGYTVYFSDRPERIVGAHPTPMFLEGLGFPDDNPPNAALVVETEAGQTEVAVLELLNPRYDETTHTATYDVVTLAEFERTNGSAETDADLAQLLSQFGAAHLFIDDCADSSAYCDVNGQNVGPIYQGGYCYSWGSATCLPCQPWNSSSATAGAYWDGQCNAVFPACGGQCRAWNVCAAPGLGCNPGS
jgi:hypothetical protein